MPESTLRKVTHPITGWEMTAYTRYHGKYFAHRIMLQGRNEEAFAKSLSTARVEMKPHQVEAARFALHSPLSKGVILADEVGLGKTIEACLVIAQKWAERRRHVLLIVPASLRTQWQQELQEKFSLPSVILDSKTHRDAVKAGRPHPFDNPAAVIITSYQYAARKHDELRRIAWDLVVIDEAHRLRNVYKKGQSAQAKQLRDALASRFKIMLTATPLQNSLMELYGLVSVIDDSFFGDEQSFRGMYGRTADRLSLQGLRRRLSPIYKRHLRRDIQEAGHVSFTKRIAVTFDFEPHDREAQLYEGVSEYLQRKDSIAFGSLCFALATGVGKTRLMGAFIAYLYLTGRSKHFFILAPNTTIYDKLVADFSQQNSPKYVFRGIAEFAQLPPIVETGDNWERGYAVRGDLLGDTAVVFIFNVDKINKEQGRIRKLHEYIGESYFEYLSGLPDLVLLMDEEHRYRAKAGMEAIAELRPVIGLELTATPRSVGARSTAFKNVIYDYPLGQAMVDGYVKDPAVATREGFRADKDKLIVEIKAKNEMSDPNVQAKAKAAQKWVYHANEHAKETGGKPWTYMLVPHDAVRPSATLASLASAYSQAELI
jgi:superfamily II DNA or RNA helicase